MPSVVWAEESKTGLRFEIGPSYGAVPTSSQLVTHRQSSCSKDSRPPLKASRKRACNGVVNIFVLSLSVDLLLIFLQILDLLKYASFAEMQQFVPILPVALNRS